MRENIKKRFNEFVEQNRFQTKGPLCVGLTITRHAIKNGLPLDPDSLLTKKGGQVATLGKAQVQAILSEYQIATVLAEEGGRTSRGSIDHMRLYVRFLNDLNLDQESLQYMETLWVDRVRDYFARKPFKLRFDASQSMRMIVKDLLRQAEKRQKENPGMTIVGTVLQHLVGAKLDVLTEGRVIHHGANVADVQSGRAGDFLLDDVAIHVTVFPGEALMRKCQENLRSNLRPVVMTREKGNQIAEGLAEQFGILERIDIFDAEQFLAGNFYELGKFEKNKREIDAKRILEKYNVIIDQYETDPSLRVEM